MLIIERVKAFVMQVLKGENQQVVRYNTGDMIALNSDGKVVKIWTHDGLYREYND